MDLENRFQTDKLGCSRKGSSPIDHEEELEKRITHIKKLQKNEEQIISELEKGNLGCLEPNTLFVFDIEFPPTCLYSYSLELTYHQKRLKDYKIKEQNLSKELTESQGYSSSL